MARYVMVGLSAARPGRDREFNEWFDHTHLPQMLALPGMISARRFDATDFMLGAPGPRYLSILEIESDDIDGLIAELGRRGAAGEITGTEEIDEASAALWLYAARAAGA